MAKMISWQDFEKIDMRTGTIVSAELFPKARKPAYKLQINFGNDIGIKKSSAQLTDYYDPETLVGTQIIAVVNFPPKQIGPFVSECLVMGAYDASGKVILITPNLKCENGASIG